MTDLPDEQYAIQLTAPDELILNKSKKITRPGRDQILCRVEAVGLCFSDLKLLKQFSNHVRKREIISGIDKEVLKQIPGYVPGMKPAVPGHEAAVRIVAAGDGVEDFKPGERYLVQTDYRWLPTRGSNAAFGYNFEGALQQYVLMDKRIITSPRGRSMLIPVSERLCASAVALVEPWACVEHSYSLQEKTKIKADDKMLIVAGQGMEEKALDDLFNQYGRPGEIVFVSRASMPRIPGCEKITVKDISEAKDFDFDHVIYLGSEAETIENLFKKLKPFGLLNIVQCGNRIGRDVLVPVGKVHYEGLRIVGEAGSDPSRAMKSIPQSGEIKSGDEIHIIGGAGPMGMMHTTRNITLGVKKIEVVAADLDQNRLDKLSRIAAALARKNKSRYLAYNPAAGGIDEQFDYTVLMVPSAEIVSESVVRAARGGIINIFAGIPKTEKASVDLNGYIDKRVYFLGASGSVLGDMEQVLSRVTSGLVDTNLSVAAVSGLEGAIEGLRAMEQRAIRGKIIVYPFCKGLGLTPLEDMDSKIPELFPFLQDGFWNKQAEDKLLSLFCEA